MLRSVKIKKQNERKRSRVRQLLQQGLRQSEIAKQFGVSRQRIHQLAKEFGYCNGPLRGEKHANSKLTQEAVIKARRDYRNGVRMAELCDLYGVTQHAMYDALIGDSWNHVSEEPAVSKEEIATLRRRHGEEIHSAILTERDVIEIRRDLRTTRRRSITEWAHFHAVTWQCIYYAATGRSWNHLEKEPPLTFGLGKMER